jgi:hypothetical protein
VRELRRICLCDVYSDSGFCFVSFSNICSIRSRFRIFWAAKCWRCCRSNPNKEDAVRLGVTHDVRGAGLYDVISKKSESCKKIS